MNLRRHVLAEGHGPPRRLSLQEASVGYPPRLIECIHACLEPPSQDATKLQDLQVTSNSKLSEMSSNWPPVRVQSPTEHIPECSPHQGNSPFHRHGRAGGCRCHQPC